MTESLQKRERAAGSRRAARRREKETPRSDWKSSMSPGETILSIELMTGINSSEFDSRDVQDHRRGPHSPPGPFVDSRLGMKFSTCPHGEGHGRNCPSNSHGCHAIHHICDLARLQIPTRLPTPSRNLDILDITVLVSAVNVIRTDLGHNKGSLWQPTGESEVCQAPCWAFCS